MPSTGSTLSGPRSQLLQPLDNDSAGLDQESRKRTTSGWKASTCFRFSVQLIDRGEAGTATGTGSTMIWSPRFGHAAARWRTAGSGVDYRFDYQTTTDQILLTPQAGVWLPGYTYEIRLVNEDRFVITPDSADQIADGQNFRITDANGRTVRFEFESGYTLEVPLPLGLLVPPGTTGLSAVADRDLFTLSNGIRLVTFEFDSDGRISSGRIRVPFTASDTPEQVADAIVAAIELANLGLSPENLGGGVVHIGGPSNTLLDTSLSSLSRWVHRVPSWMATTSPFRRGSSW